MLRPPTTSWWPFPPYTREVQFDEKWSFVHKKQRNCDPDDPADDHCGDYWDYVAYDPEHKLVLAVIPGARTEENGCAIVGKVAERLGGTPPELMTSDEYPVYETAIHNTFGEPVPAERKPGRPRVVPQRRVPEGVVYATVHKHRKKGRVVAVEPRLVFGSEDELEEALGESCASRVVNTSFVERRNATDRHRNAQEGAEDVSVQQGLAGARGDDLLDAVRLQLLLVCPDAAGQGRGGAVAGADAGPGRRVDRPRMDLARVVHSPGRSASVGHHPIVELLNIA